MNEWLHNWIAGLTAAAVTAAAAELLTPPGPVEKVTRFICGIMLVAVLLGPLASVDRESFSMSLAGYRDSVADLTGDLEQQQNRLVRSYIEQECAAYILDEAQVLGVDLFFGRARPFRRFLLVFRFQRAHRVVPARRRRELCARDLPLLL